MSVNKCLFGFMILIYLFVALPSKIVITVVKMKRLETHGHDIVDLLQYLLLNISIIIAIFYHHWILSSIEKAANIANVYSIPGHGRSTKDSVSRSNNAQKDEAGTRRSSAISATTNNNTATRTKSPPTPPPPPPLPASQQQQQSEIYEIIDEEAKLPTKFRDIWQKIVAEVNFKKKKSYSAILVSCRIIVIILVSLICCNRELDNGSMSTGIHIFTWISNISQVTIGILASIVLTKYTQYLLVIHLQVSQLNQFIKRCTICYYPDTSASEIANLVNYVAFRYESILLTIKSESRLKLYTYHLLYTALVLYLITMVVNYGHFHTLSILSICIISIGIVYLLIAMTILFCIEAAASNTIVFLQRVLRQYSEHFSAIHSQFYLLQSAVFSERPNFRFFRLIDIKKFLYTIFVIILIIVINRLVT